MTAAQIAGTLAGWPGSVSILNGCFLDFRCQFDSADCHCGGVESLEAQHRTDPLWRARKGHNDESLALRICGLPVERSDVEWAVREEHQHIQSCADHRLVSMMLFERCLDVFFNVFVCFAENRVYLDTQHLLFERRKRIFKACFARRCSASGIWPVQQYTLLLVLMQRRQLASRCNNGEDDDRTGSQFQTEFTPEIGITGGFFAQLMPMLADRTVTMIVSKADEHHLTVSVFPKRMKDSESGALATPLCCTDP